MRTKLCTVDHRHGIGIVQDVIKFIVKVTVINIYWNESCLEASHQSLHVLGAVAQVNGDFIARRSTLLKEGASQVITSSG